ncbi:polysaccharide deacetylase family protein [Clostridium sp. 'deep sea']|uniref:polysaccharide deacetylase family protein n=1 Tax=Clostridium sp. 'deep sea' TaxID=2779445 RepID=UPI0018968172|nr:polysaccharide deacetylase family protein [Clostridium sp. 'deep sea']QOR34020.1 polysaccharide deacetylase family protein [Clostridium sp. 'deep sea']
MKKNVFNIGFIIILFFVVFCGCNNEYSSKMLDDPDSHQQLKSVTIKQGDIVNKAEANFIKIDYLAKYFNLSLQHNDKDSFHTIKGKSRVLYLAEKSEIKDNYTCVYNDNWQETYISSFVKNNEFYIQLEDVLAYFNITDYRVDVEEVSSVNSKNSNLKVPILLYHYLLPEKDMKKEYWHNDSIMTVENFERTIDFIYKQGYKTISFKDYVAAYNGLKEIPEKSVIITFDDGYYSDYKYAYPILKKYGYVASSFVITRFVYEDDPYGLAKEFQYEALPYLTWNSMNSMRDVFSFHSHTHNFHRKGDIGPYYKEKSLSLIKEDLIKSDEILRSRNYNNVKILAYPYGYYNNKVVNLLTELNYDMALTVKPGSSCLTHGIYQLKRYVIFNRTSNEKLSRILHNR